MLHLGSQELTFQYINILTYCSMQVKSSELQVSYFSFQVFRNIKFQACPAHSHYLFHSLLFVYINQSFLYQFVAQVYIISTVYCQFRSDTNSSLSSVPQCCSVTNLCPQFFSLTFNYLVINFSFHVFSLLSSSVRLFPMSFSVRPRCRNQDHFDST